MNRSIKNISTVGQEIEKHSLAIVEGLLPPLPLSPEEKQVVMRLVHASGDPELAIEAAFHPRAIESGLASLRARRPIFTDVRMVAIGIDSFRAAALGCEVHCALDELKKEHDGNRTRVAAAMLSLGSRLESSLVAIGNAPTALLSLLELVDSGIARPAIIIGMPVGFVACQEAKEKLMRGTIPYIVIKGSRGGSPLAAAAVNALLRLALREETANSSQ